MSDGHQGHTAGGSRPGTQAPSDQPLLQRLATLEARVERLGERNEQVVTLLRIMVGAAEPVIEQDDGMR